MKGRRPLNKEIVYEGPTCRVEKNFLDDTWGGVVLKQKFSGLKTEAEAYRYVLNCLEERGLVHISKYMGINHNNELEDRLEAAQSAIAKLHEVLAFIYVTADRIDTPSISRPAKRVLDETGGAEALKAAVETQIAPLPSLIGKL